MLVCSTIYHPVTDPPTNRIRPPFNQTPQIRVCDFDFIRDFFFLILFVIFSSPAVGVPAGAALPAILLHDHDDIRAGAAAGIGRRGRGRRLPLQDANPARG